MTIATGDETGVAIPHINTGKTLKPGFPMLMLRLNTNYQVMTPVTLCSTNVDTSTPETHFIMRAMMFLIWGEGYIGTHPLQTCIFRGTPAIFF